MARVRSQQPVLPSLLDRLLDNTPEEREDSAQHKVTRLVDLKAKIRRDLENLLNTRLYRQHSIEPYPELRTSIANYGLPDFSTVLLGSAEHREHFQLTLQATINRFEPRLQRVLVEIEQGGEAHDRTLYLKIAALLMVEPDPVPLLFDSRIRTLDRAVKLRELQHG